MKRFAVACAALTLGTTFASAEEWSKERYPYAREHHERCQIAANRLHQIDVEIAEHEGRRHELRAESDRLVAELDHDCGGWRWRK